MVSIKFDFDERGFRNAVSKATNDAVKQSANEAQRAFDSVYRSQAGHPVDEVLTELRRTTDQLGWTASDEDLRGYAEAISEGSRIIFRPGQVNL